MAKLETVVEENIARYAGAVLVNRALCDSRDMLKPSARTLIYSQIETSKNLPSKPYMKCARIVGDALGHRYTHGDSSCYGIYARLSKPFAMRYPLEDFHGNYGTLKASGNEAASRYTEIRLSELGYALFHDINKNTIEDWETNFDETEKYPRVSTSRGFYNIVNGSTGISYGAAASIPQFNLKEVNEALIKLLWNPEIDDREIICIPDYATGGILLNKDEVIESLLQGSGKSCRLRSVIEYDNKNRTLHVTEIPYGLYTNTIREQIIKLIEENENIGIEGMNDMSARNADIEIYLSKKANPNKVLQTLYKKTSLESYCGINLTMLKDGRFPKVFTWKEALQSYIDHQILVYTKRFQFDLNKAKNRLHIVEGLIKATSIIEEVVTIIKQSSDNKNAIEKLIKNFNFTEIQSKAILDLKLSRLTHLDIVKLNSEQESLNKEIEKLIDILNNESKLKKEIEKDLKEVSEKFGDARRTKIQTIIEDENGENLEVKQLQLSLTNQNNLFLNEVSSLYAQKRGGVGAKIKLNKGENIIESLIINSNDKIIFFSESGNYYTTSINNYNFDKKIAIEELINSQGEKIIAVTALSNQPKQFIIFITKNGYIKKSLLSEYNTKRQTGVKALNLEENDAIVSVLFTDKEKISLCTEKGLFLMIDSSQINPIGRVARGIKGIKLSQNDYIINSHIVQDNAKYVVSITEQGYIKSTSINEFRVQNTNTKGVKIQKINEDDKIADFLVISDYSEITVSSENSIIKIKTEDIPIQSRGTLGVKAIKIQKPNKVKNLN